VKTGIGHETDNPASVTNIVLYNIDFCIFKKPSNVTTDSV